MAGQISRMTQGRFDRAPVPVPDSYVTVDTPTPPADAGIPVSGQPMLLGPIGTAPQDDSSSQPETATPAALNDKRRRLAAALYVLLTDGTNTDIQPGTTWNKP